MKRLSPLLTLSLLISFTACKTQEDIRREKTVENLNEQVVQTQKNTANASARFNAIEEQLAKLTGQIEETGHNKQQEFKDVALLKERLQSLEETSKKQTEYLRGLNEKLQEQSKYIDQVIKSLSTLTEQKEISKKKDSNETKESKEDISEGPATVKNGINKFKSRDFEGAKETLLAVLETKKIKKNNKN